MMRVLLDTNVVLDYLLNRMPWADHAQVIWQAHEAGRLNAHIAATTLTDIFYIVRKGLGLELAWTGVHTCLDQLIVVGVDLPDLRSACSFSGRDFEDNLQLACAVNIGAQFIITRDPAGFVDGSIPVVSPEEMANRLMDSVRPTQIQQPLSVQKQSPQPIQTFSISTQGKKSMSTEETPATNGPVANAPTNFIHDIIAEHAQSGRFGGRVHTRFPPEPNGYLHIGHAKSICLNFGLAKTYGGKCNLRFDDTNPTKEDVEYVDSIMDDVRWLGFEWDGLFYASDYFETLYQYAEQLIEKGLAYVDSSTTEEVRAQRGSLTEAGQHNPYRERSVAENLDLFRRMRAGEFPDGAHVLRAKIDMAHPNLTMRDPLLYRIRHAHHHRTGDAWCIYPLYDFTHGYSDSLEGITHSICTLEFENHRPLYDWLIDALGLYHPQQIEFARLNLTHTMMSKRKLLELVETKSVSGWDDPRMPTIAGIRRRGYTPAAMRAFCEEIGVTRFNGITSLGVLENAVRADLNKHAPRAMAVLKPLKIVLTNYPDGQVEELEAVNNPEDPAAGTRLVPFSKTLYIEHDDFREDPPKQFFRLAPGREVRLRYGYLITCQEAVKDPITGEINELRCTYDPLTRGGNAPDGRKVKSTIHWVSAEQAISAEVRLYDHLFSIENVANIPEGEDWKTYLNPRSLEVVSDAKLERSLATSQPGYRCQFERLGYFRVDTKDSKPDHLVFNRTVTLKDTLAKIEKRGA